MQHDGFERTWVGRFSGRTDRNDLASATLPHRNRAGAHAGAQLGRLPSQGDPARRSMHELRNGERQSG
jgi:hypothetical protein